MLQFETGPLFTLGKLTIEGLDLNGEPAVRKMWGVQENKPFNSTYPDYFLQRIREEGMFDGLGSTKATIKADPGHPRRGCDAHVRVRSQTGDEKSPARPGRSGETHDRVATLAFSYIEGVVLAKQIETLFAP